MIRPLYWETLSGIINQKHYENNNLNFYDFYTDNNRV